MGKTADGVVGGFLYKENDIYLISKNEMNAI